MRRSYIASWGIQLRCCGLSDAFPAVGRNSLGSTSYAPMHPAIFSRERIAPQPGLRRDRIRRPGTRIRRGVW